jgi:hypothetical protein
VAEDRACRDRGRVTVAAPLPSPKVVPIRPPGRAQMRFRWMAEAFASPQFTDGEKCILVRLAMYQNMDTGRLYPSIETLARDTNQSRRQVERTIAKAVRFGWLERTVHRGRGRANDYNLKNPTGESGYSKKPDSGVAKPPSKTRLTSRANRIDLTEGGEDSSKRPTWTELRAKFPDLIKSDR